MNWELGKVTENKALLMISLETEIPLQKVDILILLDVITGELTLSRAIVDSEALCILLILITETRPCGHIINESLQSDSLCCRWN